jgi:hypothetical protein
MGEQPADPEARRGRPRRPSWATPVCGSCRPANSAGAALVGQRLSRELRLQPGLHRRIRLADHVGVGVGDRAELFGSFSVVRRIDRDVRPLFLTGSEPGGMVNQYPFVRDGWSGNQFGDFWLGAKVNLASEFRQQPVAFALRGLVKLPTASDDDEGVGTGKAGFRHRRHPEQGDQPAGRALGLRRLMFRGDPDGVN